MAIRLEIPADRVAVQRHRQPVALCAVGLFTTLTVLITVLLAPSFWHWGKRAPDVCLAHSVRPRFVAEPHRINERHTLFPDNRDILLVNATLIDGDGTTHENTNVLVHNSTIVAVSTEWISSLPGRANFTDIVDLQGKYLTPGLIDMHSHFGTRVQPQLKGTEDTNEFTSPVTPFVRSIDGIDSQDPELTSLAAAGVTTHLVLTGSKNLISGESYAVKMLASPHNLVDELLVQHGMPQSTAERKQLRWFKMAYGENEKQTGLPGYPVSRIGAIWRIREAFDSARQLLKAQDTWCSEPRNWDSPDSYPTDMHKDTLVDILRGDVNVHIHLYEAYDFESIIRVADEFGFHISAFHHALSAYKVPELLNSHNATVAIFADEWGGKKEMYDATVHAPKMLEEQGVPVAIKTDHPALPGQQLLYFAQIAHHYGLEKALQSLTSIPAASIGLAHRIGYVRPGYDADLVVWDRHPLTLGALTLETVIDGVSLFGFEKVQEHVVKSQEAPRQWESKTSSVCDTITKKKNLVVKGITESVVPGFVFSASKGDTLTAVIIDGVVVCVGGHKSCDEFVSNGGFTTVEVTDGHLIPGVTTMAEGLGLREMVLEDATSDGTLSDSEKFVSAADGLQLDGILIERLNRAGITQGVTAPIGNAFRKGYSTHFKLSSPYALSSSIIQDKVAVHFNVGNQAKSFTYPTISSQVAELREYLSLRVESLPVVVHTHNQAVMGQVIRLSEEFPDSSFIIFGGQEAHLIAAELAAANISLILSPWRCTAKFWDNRHCSNGWPLERPSVDILYEAGVKFSVAYEDASNLRKLFWEAGEATKAIGDGVSLEESVKLVTGNLETAFGVKSNGDVLVFEHNPFEFGAVLALTVESGAVGRCYPDPEEAKHGDMLF